MKDILTTEDLEFPKEVTVEARNRIVTVKGTLTPPLLLKILIIFKGPLGTLKRNFKHLSCEIVKIPKKDNKVRV